MKSQPALALQLASEFAGTGQVMQSGPHAVTEVFETHTPPQSREPLGQEPLHEADWAMHVPAHGF